METKLKNHNTIYVKIVSFFLLLTISAIFVILHFALSKVTIKIYSNLENVENSILVEMQSENDDTISSDAILGKIMKTEFELNATSSSSYEVVPSEKAGGYVTIYNKYSKDQPLVKTTRLLTADNKLYRIQETIQVNAGESVRVWAEADKAGEEFTIGPTDKLTIPGLNESIQDKIYATAPDGMKQQGIPTYIVTEDDIKIINQELEDSAKQKILTEFNESLSDNLKITEDNLFLEFADIETTPVGSSSKEVVSKKSIKAKALVFSEEDLKAKAEEKFQKELNGEQTLVSFNEDAYSYKIIELDVENSQAILEVTLSATINNKASDLDIDKESLIGLDEQGIKDFLQEYKVDKVEIQFFPFWIKTVPKLKDHIIIE